MDVERVRKEVLQKGCVPVKQLARKYRVRPEKLVAMLRGKGIELVLKGGVAYLVVVA